MKRSAATSRMAPMPPGIACRRSGRWRSRPTPPSSRWSTPMISSSTRATSRRASAVATSSATARRTPSPSRVGPWSQHWPRQRAHRRRISTRPRPQSFPSQASHGRCGACCPNMRRSACSARRTRGHSTSARASRAICSEAEASMSMFRRSSWGPDPSTSTA